MLRRDLAPGLDGPGAPTRRGQTRPGLGEGVPTIGHPRSTFALLVAVGEVTGRVVWSRLAGGLAAREHRRPLPCQGAAADARMEPTALAHRPAGGVSPLLHGPDVHDLQ